MNSDTNKDIRQYTNGSYSVDGTVYSTYTNKPSTLISLGEAAELAGVKPKTFKRWLNHPLAPRGLKFSSGMMFVDYEVQHWLNNVINAPTVKRSWRQSIRLLKKLRLVDRIPALEKMQKLIDRNWTDIQRRVNDYDDSHIEAYRRGVKEAMNIIRDGGVACWDYVPQIGQTIAVGGCWGIISRITDTHVIVSGIYTYSNGRDDDPGFAETWTFSYLISDVLAAEIKPKWWSLKDAELPADKRMMWNYENIPHTSR